MGRAKRSVQNEAIALDRQPFDQNAPKCTHLHHDAPDRSDEQNEPIAEAAGSQARRKIQRAKRSQFSRNSLCTLRTARRRFAFDWPLRY
jgi:hypothetical protein